MAMRDLDQWIFLARATTHGLTDEQVGQVAGMCYAEEHASGQTAGVWHNTAIVCGYLACCNCAPCARARVERSSISLATFMKGAAPGDVTLGELIAAAMHGPEIEAIRQHSKYPDRVRLRVVDNNGAAAALEMTLATMRRLVRAGKLHISIDDGEGGERVNA